MTTGGGFKRIGIFQLGIVVFFFVILREITSYIIEKTTSRERNEADQIVIKYDTKLLNNWPYLNNAKQNGILIKKFNYSVVLNALYIKLEI